jgi:crossover junction endodeoxyribonuclease RuvC
MIGRLVIDPAGMVTETEQVFESCALGVDPGLTSLGIATVTMQRRRPAVLLAETVRTPADLAQPERLRRIHDAVTSAIAEHQPGSVAIERVAWNKNQVSALQVARATGVVLLAAAEAGILVEEYGPLEVKMAVTGQGNADKAQVRAALVRLHGLTELTSEPDAVDAVAVALCHLTQLPMRRAAKALAR